MVLALLSFSAPQNSGVEQCVMMERPAATPLQHVCSAIYQRPASESFEVSDTAAVFTCRLKVIFSEVFFG